VGPPCRDRRQCDIGGASEPEDLADVDFAILRAAFAVAETGSVPSSDADLHVNAVACLAQHLMLLLDPADIVDRSFRRYGGIHWPTHLQPEHEILACISR
jgi:hypothetical protein